MSRKDTRDKVATLLGTSPAAQQDVTSFLYIYYKIIWQTTDGQKKKLIKRNIYIMESSSKEIF